MKTWQLREAKSKLSDVVRLANSEGPQGITRYREPVAVLLSHDEYDRLTHPRSGFVEFIRRSPLLGVELDCIRPSVLTSKIAL